MKIDWKKDKITFTELKKKIIHINPLELKHSIHIILNIQKLKIRTWMKNEDFIRWKTHHHICSEQMCVGECKPRQETSQAHVYISRFWKRLKHSKRIDRKFSKDRASSFWWKQRIIIKVEAGSAYTAAWNSGSAEALPAVGDLKATLFGELFLHKTGRCAEHNPNTSPSLMISYWSGSGREWR